jgi:hypothetical protein
VRMEVVAKRECGAVLYDVVHGEMCALAARIT